VHSAREAELQAPLAGLEEFKRATARKLESVRCPDHRQPPRLKFHGHTLREVSVQMSGCCSKLIEIANRAIAER
jgi:hypothetical protein